MVRYCHAAGVFEKKTSLFEDKGAKYKIYAYCRLHETYHGLGRDKSRAEGKAYVPTSYISRNESAASFLGVLIPFASSFGMIELRPNPDSHDSIYFMARASLLLYLIQSLSIKYLAFGRWKMQKYTNYH